MVPQKIIKEAINANRKIGLFELEEFVGQGPISADRLSEAVKRFKGDISIHGRKTMSYTNGHGFLLELKLVFTL